MNNKVTKRAHSKDLVVASMVKKLASQPAGQDLKKKKKKIHVYVYVIIIVVIVITVMTVCHLTNEKTENDLQKVTIATIKERENPLFLLQSAFKQDSITADQYALYLKDILIRYDSLPQKYKSPRAVILDEEVYHSMLDVWRLLSLRIKNTLLQDLPGLKNKIERMKDSLGIRE
jgi:hypothetical protein